MNTLGIIIACGKEEEISSGTETAYLSLGNVPVLAHSLKTFQTSNAVDGIIVAVGKERVDTAIQIVKRYGCSKLVGIVVGCSSRLSTLRTVLSKLPEPASTLIIQEASRPFVSVAVLEETVKAAKRYGCSIAARKIPDAVKVAPKGVKAAKTLDRNSVWIAQSPQVFKAEVLEKLVDTKNKGVKLIDDESEWVRKPYEVHMVEAGEKNLKIRNKTDLAIATALLNANLV